MPGLRFLDNGLATYAYAIAGFSGPIGVGVDVWQLQGANLVTAKIRLVRLGGTANSVRQQSVQLIRRITSDTGGAPTNPPGRRADSGDQTPDAILSQFTTAPTPGTGVGVVDQATFALVTSGLLQQKAVFDYTQMTPKALVINNANEFLCVAFLGSALVGNDKLDFTIWWTEQ